MEQVTIQKMVHGGQGLGTLTDGRKVFVWNTLPGETVKVRLIRNKKDYAEGIAEEIVTASVERIAPDEPDSYLATSPWQMISYNAENSFKKAIISETFTREKIELASFEFVSLDESSGYRNKMEWGFWGDEEGISLAHFVRGSHGKTKVAGSVLANDHLNAAAVSLVQELNSYRLRGGDLKSVIIRTNFDKTDRKAVAALFVKNEHFPKLKLPTGLKGLMVYYSNPKSPASVPTKLLQQVGERTLDDTILGTKLSYDVLSFFQVNIPIFEKALVRMQQSLGTSDKIDLYSGVGSIGIVLKGTTALVENDVVNIEMAKINVGQSGIAVVHAPTEKALEYITKTHTVIVDPPRAGLHTDVIAKLIEVKPPMIAYLSCNPSTQARDVKLLIGAGYDLQLVEGYNFFPRTPHIETLAILKLKG